MKPWPLTCGRALAEQRHPVVDRRVAWSLWFLGAATALAGCHARVLVPNAPGQPPAGQQGDPCERDSQCLSNACRVGVCAEPTHVSPLLELGAPCDGADACRSGRCETFGTERLCTEACAGPCSAPGLACSEGRCTPRDYCPSESQQGPGCQGSPCADCDEAATCVQVSTHYACMCNVGYRAEGERCVRDDCAETECHNGGSCVQTSAGPECECPPGFSGAHCDVNDNDCPSDNPCRNGGTCVDGVQSYLCACLRGYTGQHCERDVDDCSGAPCRNGGTCQDEVGGYRCDCPAGFSGMHCELDDDDCAVLDPCENGGLCVDGPGSYACICPAGLTGERCETDVDECAASPCQNGGTCINTLGAFLCACPVGYSGPTCADLAPCASDLDCALSHFCDGAKCQRDVCIPGQRVCEDNAVAACEPNGAGATAVMTCSGRQFFESTCQDGHAGESATCSCADDWDCPEHTACEAGLCRGTGAMPTCSLEPLPFSEVLPSSEISWGGTQQDRRARPGTPFRDSAQVVMAPLVANLDDDNGDGAIDERDFPEIIFGTFCDASGAYARDGVLRAIHGGGPNKGKDFFAVCAGKVWHTGDDPESIQCGCAEADLDSTASFAVGDLDNDGVPEIVTITEDNRVRIHANTGDPIASSGVYDLRGPNPAVALANLDNAGLAEIIVGRRVFTLERSAEGRLAFADTFEGQSHSGRQSQGPIPCVADILGDPRLEIIAGSAVYTWPRPPAGVIRRSQCADKPATTAEEVAFCEGRLTVEWAGPIDGFCAVADVLGVDKTVPPSRVNPLDGVPELILISGASLHIFDGQSGQHHLALDYSEYGSRGGAPNVDDFDGDGFPEIGTAFARAYAVMDLQPATNACPLWPDALSDEVAAPGSNPARTPPPLSCDTDEDCGDVTSGFSCNTRTRSCICAHNGWRRITEDDSSQVTGSSVFDFNGDGAAEVVYNDECRFRVYDGLAGDVLFTEPSESRTRIEYPVVADVDNDGNAEIVFGVSNESAFCGTDTPEIEATYNTGLEVWGDATDVWVSARRVWNQHAYHVTNITESGAIPLYEPHGWTSNNGRTYNTYRSNPRTFGVAPDLTIESMQVSPATATCDVVGQLATISLKVANQGDLRVGPGVEIALYGTWGDGRESPLLDAAGRRLVLTVVNTLEPRGSIFMSVPYDAASNGHESVPSTVRAVIDHSERERECREDNNERSALVQDAAANRAELTVSLDQAASCPGNTPTLPFTVINSGTAPANGVVVRFYAGDPNQGGTLLREAIVDGTLPPHGGRHSGSLSLDGFPQCRPVRVYAVVDPDNTISECNDANNRAYFTEPILCCSG